MDIKYSLDECHRSYYDERVGILFFWVADSKQTFFFLSRVIVNVISLSTTYVSILSDIFVATLMISFLSIEDGGRTIAQSYCISLVKFGFDSARKYFKTWFFQYISMFNIPFNCSIHLPAITIIILLVDCLLFLFSFFLFLFYQLPVI